MINVQEYQLKLKEEEIYKNLLKNGQTVTTYEVIKLLNDFFEYNTLGLPYFKPIKIEAYSKSDKNIYNKMFSDINEDLNIAYEVYNNQAEYSIVTQSSYELEMEDIHNQIDALMLQTEILEEYAKTNVSYHPYVITFNSLKDVNTKNLYKNNVVYTTSEIDYNTSTLRNELHSTPNDKIDLSDATIKLSTTGLKATINKNIKTITNDINTDLVDITLSGITKTSSAILSINITLDKPKSISRVELTGYSLYNTTLKLLLSEDGENFLEKSEINGQPNNIWRFNKTKVSSIKIIITKDNYDYIEDEERFFYFILKNLSMYNDKYSNTSVYVSNLISYDKAISDITIIPDNKKPPNTDIAYFVGIEDGNKDVEWKSIKPNTKLDLGLLTKKEMVLNYFTSEIFGEWRFDRSLKEYCFYIHELPENTNINSIELRAGHSQWLIEKLQVPNVKELTKVSALDYSKSNVIAIAPLDATIMDIKCEDTWNYFVMSQNVICENDTIIENRCITFDKENEVFDYMILINGRQIFAKDDKFTFKLKKGENVVQIMILLGNLDVSNINTTKAIKHNFNLMAYCKDLYAGPKMQRVSYSSLAKNISNHSLKYYSVNTEYGKDKIIVKFDPNYMLKPTDPIKQISYPDEYVPEDVKMNNSEYFRVYLKYKNMPNSVKERLTNADGDSRIRCRIMAKLSTSDISVTPCIKSIKVVGE